VIDIGRDRNQSYTGRSSFYIIVRSIMLSTVHHLPYLF
jgi:hypothetical protein